MTTKGRLQRIFPASSVAIDVTTANDGEFLAVVAETLALMSHQAAAGQQPQVKKAGEMVDEDRDTTHPGLVTELFEGFLTAVGNHIQVEAIGKNTREEVLWQDAASPWRRSPMWLLLRVSLQLSFSRSADSLTEGTNLYKQFMVFLMSGILDMSQRFSVRGNLLYAMNAKLARRLVKLGTNIDQNVLEAVQMVMNATHLQLENRWSAIQQHNTPCLDLTKLSNLNFENDTLMTFPTLDDYIKTISDRKISHSTIGYSPVSDLILFTPNALPTTFSNFKKGDIEFQNLRGFEAWVDSHLWNWVQAHKNDSGACGQLAILMREYHSLAAPNYAGNPEAVSLMVLVMLELWTACDKIATSTCSLLDEYDPGIPAGLLQNMLLPYQRQMDRLADFEEYLASRCCSRRSPAKLFWDSTSPDCFAAKYFDMSDHHQALFQDITTRAEKQRLQKLEELRNLKEEYAKLMRCYDEAECDYYEAVIDHYTGLTALRHSNRCTRCSYKSQANSLSIEVHEWPLPADKTKAKTVVFELSVPSWFGHWRDVTVYLLLDVLKMRTASEARPQFYRDLSRDPHLNFYRFDTAVTQRIGLLSEAKPHIGTHRNGKAISTANASDVCLRNGLIYQYYDSTSGCFMDQFQLTDRILKACTYQMPQRSSSLQKYIFRTANFPSGPSPNTVIATQSECPDHMTVHEYKELSSIPLGYHIQWIQIAAQLRMPAVDFKKSETASVILQCIYQAGLPSVDRNRTRPGHKLASDEDFALIVLKNLHKELQGIERNWESASALAVFIAIARRLLSLSSVSLVRSACFEFLKIARNVAFQWVTTLRFKSHDADDADREEFIRRMVEAALICTNSFQVDEEHLTTIFTSTEDSSTFLQCCIIIFDGKQSLSNSLESLAKLLYSRHRRFLCESYDILATKNSALHDAINQSWPAYHPGSDWIISESAFHWVFANSASENETSPSVVHLNLLSGELLINGSPLDRLPSTFEEHTSYRTLFGNATLEVRPTQTPGMRFSSMRKHQGYIVDFGMTAPGASTTDLIVQASNSITTYELLPARLFRGKFPDRFVDEYVHWFNFDSINVEFRPINEPWNTLSSEQWLLIKNSDDPMWWLKQPKNGSVLISVNSNTAKALSGVFSPLAMPLRIHTTFQPSSTSLEIEIPRIPLAFTLDAKKLSLQSREFRGMFVDSDQSLGTLIGFRNKLMLTNNENSDRMALMLEGEVSYGKQSLLIQEQEWEDHVDVSIDLNSLLKLHPFRVDCQLQRLVGNGSLESSLFSAYIHALTSFCLPDPLTRKTGTEQALGILRSAAVHSFDSLSPENTNLLVRIASLTPKREYYPRYETVMQSVNWSVQLSFLSQHPSFHTIVTSIFDHAKRALAMHPTPGAEIPIISGVNQHLFERDRIRSSTFRVSGYGAEDFTPKFDVSYKGRDREVQSKRYVNAQILSSAIYQNTEILTWNPPPPGDLWNFICRSSTTCGPQEVLDVSQLRYDAGLLQGRGQFVTDKWASLHHTLSNRANSQVNKFALMIWLSTMACSESIDKAVLQTIARFYTSPGLREICAPPVESFHISNGHDYNQSIINADIRFNLRPFQMCPEFNIARGANELTVDFTNRRAQLFQSKQNLAVELLASAVQAQWPCEIPSTSSVNTDPNVTVYVDLDGAMRKTRQRIKSWFENRNYFQYLQHIEGTISRLHVSQFTCRPRKLHSAIPNHLCPGFVSIADLFKQPAPCLPQPLKPPHFTSSTGKHDGNSSRLASFAATLQAVSHESRFQETYVNHLLASIASLRGLAGEYRYQVPPLDFLIAHSESCEEHLYSIYAKLESAVNPAKSTCPALKNATFAGLIQQWPRVSPAFFLQQLGRHCWPTRNNDWKTCIVSYGLAFASCQRAKRLINLFHSGKESDLIAELRNTGHQNWDPMEYPESLLLEIESGIIIREEQERIANKMRDPSDNKNTSMQLNMGEGKSSTICPIVAAALADRSRLVRIIVGKPQAKQMAQMLIAKLGGMLDRRIYYLPFSRSLRLDETTVNIIDSICRECKGNGGILLVQPEHILSFQLMVIERHISGQGPLAQSLLRTQLFLDESSRDIIDESDENLSVKFELIYTMGLQRHMEMSPNRWIVIQQVLDLIKEIAPGIARELPSSMEIHQRSSDSFPRIRILRPDAELIFRERLGQKICELGLGGFPVFRQPEAVRNAVFVYITKFELSKQEIDQVESPDCGGFWTEGTRPTLFLLRGLLACGVLDFVFSRKRWRVNYGLDSSRNPNTRLAVPYHAKDIPSPRSEFSHPDVVILLTFLSHYYGGLDDNDLFNSFDHLLESDQKDVEYQIWLERNPNVPQMFRQLDGINLKDKPQCTSQVFPIFRHTKSTTDYFLSNFVFPKEMKEFPHKLSASGWDLSKAKQHPTTAFSGTSDSQILLPLDIAHLDLPEQRHTNALVLDNLLRPENSVEMLSSTAASSIGDSEFLLSAVTKFDPPPQVILDVGAQILEMTNLDVAHAWLKLRSEDNVQAVVFFNEKDEMSVLDRKGRVELLQTSSFADRLDACLVFLDEAHTRGTDLKLPQLYRAAVTLGANLTKDRLVQGLYKSVVDTI